LELRIISFYRGAIIIAAVDQQWQIYTLPHPVHTLDRQRIGSMVQLIQYFRVAQQYVRETDQPVIDVIQ